MDQLPPELLGVIAGGDLVLTDKIRAISRAIRAALPDPPLLVDGVPIEEVTWTPSASRSRYRITRGSAALVYSGDSRHDIVVYSDVSYLNRRIMRGYCGTFPIFTYMVRRLPSSKMPIMCVVEDIRERLYLSIGTDVYHFDVHCSFQSVLIHTSKVRLMLDSGAWR